MRQKRPNVVIYTDGACSNGYGGWAANIHYSTQSTLISGAEANTTNNRMEMTAVIKALEYLQGNCNVRIYSDSQYVVQGTNTWVNLWSKKGWRSGKGEVLNRDLWERILELKQKHRVVVEWVKGHDTDDDNRLVDYTAVKERKQLQRQMEGR